MEISKQIQEILRHQYIVAKTPQKGIETASDEIMKLINENCVSKEKSNPYFLTEADYKRMRDLKSNTVRLSGDSGIGIGIDCLVNDEWVDITDYSMF